MELDKAEEKHGWSRSVMRWLVRRYYPRMEISNADRIPQNGPVLLCANHANALMDPVLVGIAARRPVRFMAKAPLFDAPLIGPVMHALGMVPVFRGSDDSRQVRRNLESLDTGSQILLEGSAMGIFPEGKSTDAAQVEMVRSGAARMAMKAAEQGAKDLQIVPIGINYEQKEKFRSSVWIQVGEPIDADSWLEQHEGNSRKAIRALTGELESRLKQVVVHLDEVEWEPFLEDLEVLVPAPAEVRQAGAQPLRQRKRIADAMNHFLATDRPRAEATAENIKAYRNQIHATGLSIHSPVLQKGRILSALQLVWHCLLFVLLSIPALLGTLHHLVPFVLVRTIISRINQPGLKTISTNRLMVGLPAYALWYVAVTWWMHGYFSGWFVWTWLIAMPFAGLTALHYWRRAKETMILLWHQILVTVRRRQLKELLQQQSELRQRLMKLAEDYAKVSPRPQPEAVPSKYRLFARFAAWIFAGLIVAASVWMISYWVFNKSLHGSGLDLASLSPTQLRARLEADETAMLHIIGGIDELEDDAQQVQADVAENRRSYANQGDNDAVRELLRRYLSYRGALFRILWKYQRHPDVTDDRLRVRTFLLDYTAASVLYESSLKFVYQFNRSPKTVAKLNEAEPNWDIPAGLYDTIQHNLASRENNRMLEVARRYYHELQPQLDRYDLLKSAPYLRFHAAIARSEETIRNIDESIEERVIEVAAGDLVKLAKQVHYETQSAISTWIGDLKIREPRQGKTLIDKGQLAELRKKLKPGDILLERRNWYLSNAFLPGYWPHGAVYVGTVEDLKQRGLDQNEYVQKHWDAFSKKDHAGHEHVIIEAVSEGVIFSSLEHSMGGGDSVAVLRPNLSEDQKSEAIIRAFSFAGRPYDFEFDFSTTDKLVCTEVVFRAYGGNSGPITFPVVEILGRPTMPAINLVEKFSNERNREDAELQFVAFLDGDEELGTSVVRDEDAFVKTLDLPGLTWWSNFKKRPVQSTKRFGWVALGLVIFFVVCWAVYKPQDNPETEAGAEATG